MYLIKKFEFPRELSISTDEIKEILLFINGRDCFDEDH